MIKSHNMKRLDNISNMYRVMRHVFYLAVFHLSVKTLSLYLVLFQIISRSFTTFSAKAHIFNLSRMHIW